MFIHRLNLSMFFLFILNISITVIAVHAGIHHNILTVDATDREISINALNRGYKMGYKSKYLSHDEICAIYKCLNGHIHVKYRTLDIAMEPEEFLQVAQVFTDALRILQRKEDTVNEEISLADIGAIQKV